MNNKALEELNNFFLLLLLLDKINVFYWILNIAMYEMK